MEVQSDLEVANDDAISGHATRVPNPPPFFFRLLLFWVSCRGRDSLGGSFTTLQVVFLLPKLVPVYATESTSRKYEIQKAPTRATLSDACFYRYL